MLKTIKVIFLPSLSLSALLIPENRIEIWKDIGYTGRQCQKQQQMQSGGNTSNIKSLEVLFWFQDEYI